MTCLKVVSKTAGVLVKNGKIFRYKLYDTFIYKNVISIYMCNTTMIPAIFL